MSSRRGASIKIFLPNGSTVGIWAVDLSNWTGHALLAPRSSFLDLMAREELNGPGVYVLLGPGESAAKSTRIYVGEADVLRTRLKQQQGDKDFWTRAIIFTTRDASFNKARVKYIESRLIEMALEFGRAEVANSAMPKRPALSEADIAEVEGFIDKMLVIYPVLGVTAFERVQTKEDRDGDAPIFLLKGADTDASGAETADGFIVFAGSKGRATHVPSIHEYGVALRESLLVEGAIRLEGDHLVFTKDCLFASPSTAAMVLLGRTSNGRKEWKTDEGLTLRQHQEGKT